MTCPYPKIDLPEGFEFESRKKRSVRSNVKNAERQSSPVLERGTRQTDAAEVCLRYFKECLVIT